MISPYPLSSTSPCPSPPTPGPCPLAPPSSSPSLSPLSQPAHSLPEPSRPLLASIGQCSPRRLPSHPKSASIASGSSVETWTRRLRRTSPEMTLPFTHPSWEGFYILPPARDRWVGRVVLRHVTRSPAAGRVHVWFYRGRDKVWPWRAGGLAADITWMWHQYDVSNFWEWEDGEGEYLHRRGRRTRGLIVWVRAGLPWRLLIAKLALCRDS